MSIDVILKAKLFGKKTMPLAVILGEKLRYGAFCNGALIEGEMGENEFVAFDPESIGRGFSVVWNPQELKEISFRLPQPTTEKEYDAFYASVKRAADYWNGSLTVDGSKMKLEEFLAGLKDMKDFNKRLVGDMAKDVLSGKQDSLTLYSAKVPLTFGPEEARLFEKDHRNFEAWLHIKQTVDAFYIAPEIYQGEEGNFFGVLSVSSEEGCILEKKPHVPFGVVDPKTGKAIQTEDFRVLVGLQGADAPLGELSYEAFFKHLPQEKISYYDFDKILLAPLTESEIRRLLI